MKKILKIFSFCFILIFSASAFVFCPLNIPTANACQSEEYITCQNLTENRRIEAMLATNVYSITYKDENGYNLLGLTPTSYTYGVETQLPTKAIKEGCVFVGWFDNASFEGNVITTISASDLGDKVFYAQFEVRTYKISVTQIGNGKITSNTSGQVNYGESVTFTIKADDGWKLSNVYINQKIIEISDDKLIIENIKENLVIEIIFEEEEVAGFVLSTKTIAIIGGAALVVVLGVILLVRSFKNAKKKKPVNSTDTSLAQKIKHSDSKKDEMPNVDYNYLEDKNLQRNQITQQNQMMQNNMNSTSEPGLAQHISNTNLANPTINKDINPNMPPRQAVPTGNSPMPPRQMSGNMNSNVPVRPAMQQRINPNIQPKPMQRNMNPSMPPRQAVPTSNSPMPPRQMSGNMNSNVPVRPAMQQKINPNIQPKPMQRSMNPSMPPRGVNFVPNQHPNLKNPQHPKDGAR